MAWTSPYTFSAGAVLTAAQLNTYVSDNLAYLYAKPHAVMLTVYEKTQTVATGTYNAVSPPMPSTLNAYALTDALGTVFTTSSSGNLEIKVARGRQANSSSAHTWNYIFTTSMYIDANEYYSKDAGTQLVIGGTYDDINTGDLFRVDVIGAGTGAAGLWVTLEFEPE